MDNNMKIILVGGAVRDKIMGIQSKDLDYVCVLESIDGKSVKQGYNEMRENLLQQGFEFFLETPKMFTIRARFPKGHKNEKQTADFVLARKEIGYIKKTRRPRLKLGTLYDDLERRDFRMNAIAEDEDGTLIDPFNGINAIVYELINTPNSAEKSFDDDPLRILRAIRFEITKGFSLSQDVVEAMHCFDYENKFSVVSRERIREELLKCFKHDTLLTLNRLGVFKELRKYIFKNNLLWLMPTMKEK